jgi:hypothetical protein
LWGLLNKNWRIIAGIRPDITVFTSTHIYVFEFKLDQTAILALQQILNKDYFRPFQMDPRKKVAVGVNFSSKTKAVDNFLVQEA